MPATVTGAGFGAMPQTTLPVIVGAAEPAVLDPAELHAVGLGQLAEAPVEADEAERAVAHLADGAAQVLITAAIVTAHHL
ncbi:hypothetical protein [Candidatus Solirubrobacter pratensis]|uniref:hypothetical protein n=1 Tax=Candidatus Solirubrobacter pratensis TaxID=1298857 RepID=UPI000417B7E6|nr:hypothetical protein [Candidatus Solirubrobacter pratensis]